MNHRAVLHISLIIIALSFASFRWPVGSGTITSTFCESRWDHFHDGIDITSFDGKVYPVEPGTLLYYWDKTLFPLDNYPGGGNYKILAHRNGLYSVYMHLENGMSSKKIYIAEDTVGIMGDTGHSGAKHVHFSIGNAAASTSMNPLKLLPPHDDTRPPIISEMAFHIGDKYVIVRDKANIRLTKHYPLLLKVTDSMQGRESLGIYKMSVLFNGRKVYDKEFASLSSSKGAFSVQGKGFDSLFDRKGYYKVEGLVYAEGENVVHVTAADFSGNTTEAEFTFVVHLDMDKE
jgi:hypothetical protein